MRIAIAVLLLLCGAPHMRAATIVYDNTVIDTFAGYTFISGGLVQIGDTVSFGAPPPGPVTQASVQFFNAGASGTFDAILRFFNPGAPVGTIIGAPYTLSGLSLGAGDVLTATFLNLNAPLPETVVFTIAVSNVTGGADIGLTAFDPPAIGSSDNSLIIVDDGSGFSESLVSEGQGNLYLRLVAIPESATMLLCGAGLSLLYFVRRKP
ncbi:MAG TPA: hypothetical protein DEH78_13690 [Solibacterales bacterium]|nr:hypothetical protein [Bryobacterales bacterium]